VEYPIPSTVFNEGVQVAQHILLGIATVVVDRIDESMVVASCHEKQNTK